MGIGIDSFDAGPAGKIHFARCNCLFHGHKCLQGWNRALGSSAWNVHVPDGNEAIFSNAWGHGLCVSSHNDFLSPTLAVVAVFPANDGNSKGFQVWKTRWWGLLECSSQCMWCRQHVAESSAAVLVWPLPTQLDWKWIQQSVHAVLLSSQWEVAVELQVLQVQDSIPIDTWQEISVWFFRLFLPVSCSFSIALMHSPHPWPQVKSSGWSDLQFSSFSLCRCGAVELWHHFTWQDEEPEGATQWSKSKSCFECW